MTRTQYLYTLAAQRVLVLDGAMGTLIQQQHPATTDFCTEVLTGTGAVASGCNELLNLTRPDMIFDIHTQYLHAGADIIETNTFCANAFSLEEYGLQDHVEALNTAACEIARAAVQEIEAEQADRFAFVAGIVGPTGRALSFSSSVEDPAYRKDTFEEFRKMYAQQIRILVAGGVDLILLETCFDTLVTKSALAACHDVFAETGTELPIMVSVTFSDRSGRTLSGQDLQALVVSLSHEHLFSLGMNCSTGAREMLPMIEQLSMLSPFRVSAHPNAGFPDKDGNYTQTPSDMAVALEKVLATGCLNVVGGCCGTTPQHIKAIAQVASQAKVHQLAQPPLQLRLSGLDALVVPPVHDMLVIGERNNVAGSKKFARLIRQGQWDEALSIAHSQVEQGAQILDVCMDASLIDAPVAMVTFLRYMASDPTVASVPVMVDSSDWTVVQAALGELQGRAIINSISLKEGAQAFVAKALEVANSGCVFVVMLFDEQGQADTLQHKIEIAQRSYDLLVGAGIDPASIIMDPNVLAVATGIDGHDDYARSFVQAVQWIKEHLAGVSTSGGISNLSFSFRGNTLLRKAMHCVFLHHCVEVGFDMAIVNPAELCSYEDLPDHVRTIIEEALFDPSAEHRQKLVDLASSPDLAQLSDEQGSVAPTWRTDDVRQNIIQAVVRGDDTFLQQDLQVLIPQVLGQQLSPVTIVEGPLMEGMGIVGSLFGDGKLYLPQVVRSARVMKHAVDILQPSIQAMQHSAASHAGTVVLATVKGDVHDIGKNIVSLVLTCNNFHVVDLGVMVPPQAILDAAVAQQAQIIALSGLITPSLQEMARVCNMCQEAHLTIPIMVGGATTTPLHTALKLDPLYDSYVVQTSDASSMVRSALQIVSPAGPQFLKQTREYYHRLASEGKTETPLIPYGQAVDARIKKREHITVTAPEVTSIPMHLADLEPLVNWSMIPVSLGIPSATDEASNMIEQAQTMLRDDNLRQYLEEIGAVLGIFPANSNGEDILFDTQNGQQALHFLRQQQPDNSRSLCDLANESEPDSIGLFAVTAGLQVAAGVQLLKSTGDDLGAILLQVLADRLAEAAAQRVNVLFDQQQQLVLHGMKSIRPAPGYPAWPDHSEKRTIFDMLQVQQNIGVTLTESYAMDPPASICGCILTATDPRYFALGPVGADQVSSYCRRKGCSASDLALTVQGME